MQISIDSGNNVLEKYRQENVVWPPSLEEKLFTTSCIDKIDQNPSLAKTKDSFHGTAISLTPHPYKGLQRSERSGILTDTAVISQKLTCLPEVYTNIPPLIVHTTDSLLPKLNSPLTTDSHAVLGNHQKEKEWLLRVSEHVSTDQVDRIQAVTWSDYHGSLQPPSHKSIAITELLPLFDEYALSFEMMRDSICVMKAATERINP